jgi:hypothetical protein
MPGAYVIAMAEDSRGALWIGTSDGLCRWDGARFYTPPEQYSILPTPLVRCLHMANDSLLIVGTQNGLCVYNIFACRYDHPVFGLAHARMNESAKMRTVWALSGMVGGGGNLVALARKRR